MDCLKETGEIHGGELHSDLFGNTPTTGSESLNSTREFFCLFHSDSAKIVMLQKVQFLILKLNMLNQNTSMSPS